MTDCVFMKLNQTVIVIDKKGQVDFMIMILDLY